MTTDFEKLSRTVLRLTEAVGNGEMSATDALVRLEAAVVESCDLAGTSIAQVACMGTEVLAILVPEKKDIVLMRDDGSKSEEGIPPEVLTRIMIRVIMRGMERHSARGNRKAGASALLAVCPNPIPRSDTPFDDSKELRWDTTQRRIVID